MKRTRTSGLQLAVHGAVGRVALRLAPEGGDLPARGLLGEEEALAAGQVHLRVRELDVDVLHGARLQLHLADRVGAGALLLALELRPRVLAERRARRVAPVRAVGREEAR